MHLPDAALPADHLRTDTDHLVSRGAAPWLWLLGGVALAPLVVRVLVLGYWLIDDPPSIRVVGDDAIIELYTLHAARGTQMLGPYSRYGWHHPGPTYFYVLLPIYEFAGRHAIGIHLGALLINTGAAIMMVFSAYRLGGSHLAMWFTVLTAVHTALFARILSHPLNPFVTIIPFVLFLIGAAGLASGRLSALPLVVTAGSFVIQSHVGYSPIGAAVFAGAALTCLIGSGRRIGRSWRTRASTPIVVAIFVGTALWILPVAEELLGRPGNITVLLQFFASRQPEHSVGETFEAFAWWTAAAPLFLLHGLQSPEPGAFPSMTARVLALSLPPALVGGYLVARHTRSTVHCALCIVGIIAYAAAFWSVSRIVGPIAYYLVLWLAGLGLYCWLSAISAIGTAHSMNRRHVRRLTIALCGGVVVVASWANLAALSAAPWPQPQKTSDVVSALESAVATRLFALGGGDVRVHIAAADAWPIAAGIVLQLERRGMHVTVDPDWLFTFGMQHAGRGDDRLEVMVASPSSPELGVEWARTRPLARSDGWIVVEIAPAAALAGGR